MSSSDPVIEQIKSRAAKLVPLLVDLSKYKRDGSSHVRGPCPWKPGSDSDAFRLDTTTGGWSYFVKGRGESDGTGGILSLVQNIHGMDFAKAKAWAAAKLGIQVGSNGCHPSPATAQASPIAAPGTPEKKPKPTPEPDGPAPTDLRCWFRDQYGIDPTPAQLEAWGVKRVTHGFKLLNYRKVDSLEYAIRLKGGGKTVRYRSLQRFGGKRLPAGAYNSGFQNGAFDPGGSLDKCAGDRLFLFGGEEKCQALVLDGLLAISTACGEKPTFHDDFLELLRENPPDEVIVVYDVYSPDDVGRFYSARAAKFITDKTGIPARFVRWPEDLPVGHDINDEIKANGSGDLGFLLKWARTPTEADLGQGAESATMLESKAKESERKLIEEDDWPEPVPLVEPVETLSKLPEFPLHVLPVWARDMARMTAETNQTPVTFSASLVIGIVAMALNGRVVAVPWDRWEEQVCLYTADAMETGEGKSPVVSSLMAPMWGWQRELLVEFEKEKRRIEATLEDKQKQLKAMKTKLDSGKVSQEEVDKLSRQIEGIQNPSPPRFFYSDVTPEALEQQCALNGDVISVIDDEDGVFPAIVGHYNKPGADANLAIFLKGYTGTTPIHNARISRGTTHIEAPNVNILVTPQPHILKRLEVKNDALNDRGLFGRFLFVFPAPLESVHYGPKRFDAGVTSVYHERMKQILDVPLGSGEESTRFEKAHRLKFSDEAAALFEEGINRWTDSFRSPTSPDFSMKSWMAKARGRAARIACVLHAMHRCGEPGWYELQVEPQQVRDALHLVEAFYKQHAKYAYRMMGVFRATKVDAAKEALHWMIRQKTDETGLISHRRLQQSLKNSIGGKEELIECLKLLEERGWIATVWPAPDQVRGRGAKCPLGYRLNPRAQVAMKRVGPVE